MIAHAGAWSVDGEPLGDEIGRALRRSLAARGYTGFVTIRSPGVLLMQATRAPTGPWERIALTQDAACAISFVGRLDNAPELSRTLGVTYLTPANLVARYFAWRGVACFECFIGDWTVAIWSAADRTLMLARDGLGIKHLAWHCRARLVRWSSELGPLAAVTESSTVDRAYLAGFLAGRMHPARTSRTSISAVPPGHTVIFNGKVPPRVTRFWKPQPIGDRSSRSDDDYANQLLTILSTSVHRRLQTPRPTWIELSGGLDSSTIVALSARGLERGQANSIGTITYLFDESVATDERAYSRQVKERYALPARDLREHEHSLFFYPNCHAIPDVPVPGGGRLAALLGRMHDAGVSSLLSGSGGDAVMGNISQPRMELADLTRRRQLQKLVARCRDYHRRELCGYRELLWRDVVLPLVRHRRQQVYSPDRCAWIDWTHLLSLLDHDGFDASDWQADYSPSERHYIQMVTNNAGVITAGQGGVVMGIDVSYPYLDRPLIEFMLSVPIEQRRRPGATRVLHRRAIRPLLPTGVVERVNKGDGAEAVFRAIRREWSRIRPMFNGTSHLEAYGLVSSRAALGTLEAVREGRYQDPFTLTRVVTLEAWLRADCDGRR